VNWCLLASIMGLRRTDCGDRQRSCPVTQRTLLALGCSTSKATSTSRHSQTRTLCWSGERTGTVQGGCLVADQSVGSAKARALTAQAAAAPGRLVVPRQGMQALDSNH
jgi:hypothetical protein